MGFQYILIDLDGTVTNPKEGITKSIQYALKHMGIEVDDLDSLCKHIGPPLKDGFVEFWNMNDSEALAAVEKYREYYKVTGILQNLEYEGMEELLAILREEGRKIILATSKPEIFARQIIEHFGLSQYFDDICGSNLDGTRAKKGEVIRYALDKNHIMNLNDVIMVGDRFHDIEGARENGIQSIGVLYGFGNREELEKAGAYKIAETVEDLKRILVKELK